MLKMLAIHLGPAKCIHHENRVLFGRFSLSFIRQKHPSNETETDKQKMKLQLIIKWEAIDLSLVDRLLANHWQPFF